MDKKHIQNVIENALVKGNGIMRLNPAWVARDFLPTGRRLAVVGLKDDQYEVGERGFISERWFASVTKAANRVGPPDEGLSYLQLESKDEITLKAAVESAGDLIMGKVYAANHSGLGRLFKIYDFAARIPFHMHLPKSYTSLMGLNSKEEAYFFPSGLDLGPHPETFFGVHPYITEEKKYDELLPYLKEWDTEMILKCSRAYQQVPGEGFHLPSGIPHAPGTAVTLELQEDSDVMAFLQGLVSGNKIDKELLFKDLRPEDQKKGEKFVLELVDWEASGNPYFFENRHLSPFLADEQAGGVEHWIFYNTLKFNGKRLVVKPGQKFQTKEKGVYSVLVWKGAGRYDGHEVQGGNPGVDELIVCHERAIQPLVVENTGSIDLEIIKFFGPDINPDVPMLPKYPR